MTKQHTIAIKDLPRLKNIIAILVRHGLGEFIQQLKISVSAIRISKLSSYNRHDSLARRFRLAFEELGPTFIKLGQVLSTRADIFPAPWIEEFKLLQNSVPAMSDQEVTQILLKQYGENWQQNFLDFDFKPVGSASIAQVHQAYLTNKQKVALKIKRLNVENIIQADVRILYYIASLIESNFKEAQNFKPIQIVDHFTYALQRETDFLIELRNIKHFQRIFQAHPIIHIPDVYEEMSSSDILVQEFIDGLLLNQLTDEQLDNRHLLACQISEAFTVMVIQAGFFHADLHPGNIFLQENKQLAFVDFGLVGYLSNDRKQQLIQLVEALVTKDAFSLQNIFTIWSNNKIAEDSLLGNDILELLFNYEYMSSKNLHIGQLINEIAHIFQSHAVTLPADLILLGKALISLEGSVKILDEDFIIVEHSKPIINKVLNQAGLLNLIKERYQANYRVFRQISDELPVTILKLNRKIQSGQFNIDLNVPNIIEQNKQINRATNRITMGLVTSALIIGSSIVMTIDAGPKLLGMPFFGFIGYLLAFFNSIWIVWTIWHSNKDD